jgi:hypothetical protein
MLALGRTAVVHDAVPPPAPPSCEGPASETFTNHDVHRRDLQCPVYVDSCRSQAAVWRAGIRPKRPANGVRRLGFDPTANEGGVAAKQTGCRPRWRLRPASGQRPRPKARRSRRAYSRRRPFQERDRLAGLIGERDWFADRLPTGFARVGHNDVEREDLLEGHDPVLDRRQPGLRQMQQGPPPLAARRRSRSATVASNRITASGSGALGGLILRW